MHLQPDVRLHIGPAQHTVRATASRCASSTTRRHMPIRDRRWRIGVFTSSRCP